MQAFYFDSTARGVVLIFGGIKCKYAQKYAETYGTAQFKLDTHVQQTRDRFISFFE